jgi:flagellar basal-body rod protein FlgG
VTQAFEIAGAGLVSQQKALDVIASNIANINTPSFKRSELRFSEVIAGLSDEFNPRASLSGEPSVAGVTARAVLALDAQGELEHTGRALDLAIDGAGFIELMGPRGQTLLWRGGALSIQEDGLLSTSDGLPLRAMIAVPDEATELLIDADGRVRARVAGADQPVELGRIDLVQIESNSDVERLDGGLYRLAEGVRLNELQAGEDGAGALVQGSIERSNVQINDEMVRLMIVQRAYAANAQIVQAADQLMAIANSLRK